MQQSLKQSLETKLVINQMLRQAIDLLALSNLELVQKVQQELVENPLLEEMQTESENISLDAAEKKLEESEKSTMDDEEFMVWKEHLEDDSYGGREYEVREKINYENFTSRKESLAEHLLWQLSMAKLSYHQHKIGELIIGYLDKNGYFIGKIDELSESLEITTAEVENVLKKIQRFDPLGVGARNLQECLLIQAKELYPQDKILQRLIENYFELIADKKIVKIADDLNVSTEEVQKNIEIIRSLEPKPGRQYSVDPIKYILPDVIIEKVEDKYVVIINDDYLPSLRINQYYKKLLQGNKAKEVKKYLKQKLESASWLLSSIDQRKSTLFKVVTRIVEHQKDFFDKGLLFLKPLALSDIAQAINMHESTISRVTSNKYAQTPKGIFELKYFFARGMENDFGEGISTIKIKDKIKSIIENENKSKPISDQKIAEIIKKDGLVIARRTVAKYREEMNIASSSKRKTLAKV